MHLFVRLRLGLYLSTSDRLGLCLSTSEYVIGPCLVFIAHLPVRLY